MLGDNGFIDFGSPPVLITTTDPTIGDGDTIDGDDGNDIIFGGTGGDVVTAGAGNDLIFGDHGLDGRHRRHRSRPAAAEPSPPFDATQPFAWTSIDTGIGDGGGADLLRGNAGDDIVIGGQGADRITGGDGDDDLIGGHNVAGGTDAGDVIDGGAGNDLIAGDNADLLRTGDVAQPALPGAHRRRDLRRRRRRPASPAACAGRPEPGQRASASVHAVRPLADAPRRARYGDDVIAGGADDDVIFGQLGDDWIQGDGSVHRRRRRDRRSTCARTRPVGRGPRPAPARDGDDYIEGNGGDDVIFGGLGQDDLIGGSPAACSA